MKLRWCNVRVNLLIAGVVLLPVLAPAAVLDPPSLRCASVGAAGEALLTWVAPADPTGVFLRYDVYHATSPTGPFTLVAQVPTYTQVTYTHAAAGANAAPQFYYLNTVSTSGVPNTSASSDTLATILVQVTQSVPLGSSVVDWNLPHNPPLPTAAPMSLVDLEHPMGAWVLADSVANTLHHWQRVVSICADSLAFRVHVPDASGCTSTSNAHGAFFQDISPPTVPTMVNLSVDTATNQAVLQWSPSPEADTDGYIIVLSTPGGNVILDTLYGQFNTTWTWPLSDAGAGPESYTVAAIDTCWKGIPPSPNTSAASAAHTTVHLTTTYDRCAGTLLVERTDYSGWPVDHYELYLQMDHAGPLSLVALMDPADHQHLLTGVVPGRQYCFVAKAVGLLEALSNLHCRTTAYPPVPQWNYLRTATVEADNTVLVIDSLDLTGHTRRLVLERSHNGLPWQAVATAMPGTAPTVFFTDADADPAARSYTYRVLVEDSCGNTVVTSNIGNSILLTVTPQLDGTNHLQWNGYVQWAGTVAGYNVYRSGADEPFQLVATTTAGQWSFRDDVQDLWQSPGRFCYYVEALEAGNPAGINASSTSNTACAVQQEELWVPNAFIEGGYNNTFKPVLAYADAGGFEFAIFNRWGQQIWSTTDLHQAWDGRVNGTVVPLGVYAWYCSFRNGAGKTVERRGTVTFIAGR
ncbi:MAG: gliding motility-associated C-terminal domain-containing protein [Flavobacteriales bacterium]|nr:gliding motility-associated C-terminal domain-containing protein [Flavobacteriales bacterium]MBP9079273.1 gliding motility-associated C-terminal domain-containing protein [Flavobacteriales bacterium]